MTTTEVPSETLDERIQRGLKDGTIRELKMQPAPNEHAELFEKYKNFRPSHNNWWTRSTLRRLLRIMIGLHDDVNKGELFERLLMSNIIQMTNLIQGLRNDLDAATRTQNPVNGKVVDIDERLSYYERHNDSLQPTYRKLMRRRTDEQIKRERAESAARRKAVTKELKDHAQFGELVDCKSCGKNVDGPDEKCPECNGLGVIPNPDYVPKPEEIHGSDSQEASGGSNGAGPQLVR